MRNILKNKKGSEMTIGTIVIIILALLVLVFLVFGFSMGWKNLWEKMTNLGGGSSTVDSVKQSCQIACDTNAVTSFCSEVRTVKMADNAVYKGSCNTLNSQGFEACSSIDCSSPSIAQPKKCSTLGGTGLTDTACTAPTATNVFAKVGDSENKDVISFKYCCIA